MSGWLYFLGYVSIGSLQLVSLTSIVANNFNLSFIVATPGLYGTFLVLVLGALSLRSIGIIDKIQSIATIYKLVPLFLGITALLFYFSPATTPGILSSSPLILIPTIPMAIFGFWGFEGVCSISHLIEDSKKNAPKAIFMGFIFTVLIYTLFHLSLLAIMGTEALQTHGAIGFVNYLSIDSSLVIQLLNAVVMSAIIVAHINAIFGGIVANSAMLCAMAEEKIVFMSSFFASRLPSTGRPAGAIIAHCLGIIFCITAVANAQVLNAMANLGVLTAFVFAIVALFIKTKHHISGIVSCVLGLSSCLILSFYSWRGIGATDIARLIAITPMLATLVAGYGMYWFNASQKNS
jgi:amino acid transporter